MTALFFDEQKQHMLAAQLSEKMDTFIRDTISVEYGIVTPSQDEVYATVKATVTLSNGEKSIGGEWLLEDTVNGLVRTRALALENAYLKFVAQNAKITKDDSGQSTNTARVYQSDPF